MPILLILLGAGLGAGVTILGQAVGILPAPGAEVEPGVTPPPGNGNGREPIGPVSRSGFLVFPGTTERNQIQGAIFNSKVEADDFARELAAMIPGVTVWRVELRDDRIVENSAVSFGVLRTVEI